MASNHAPITADRVVLAARDASELAAFYTRVLGLIVRAEDADGIHLGVDDRTLVSLVPAPNDRLMTPNEPGLYHTAFLLPSRERLGAFLTHLSAVSVPLTGAADHSVSEALYLDDPEGNGIEVYWDRPRTEWVWTNGLVRLGNHRIDLPSLAALAERPYDRAPVETVVGHVHLRVGDLLAAQDMIVNALSMTVTQRSASVSFFASGGYHHHLAANTWQSAGRKVPAEARTGLRSVVFSADSDAFQTLAASEAPVDDAITIAGPGGVIMRFEPRAPVA